MLKLNLTTGLIILNPSIIERYSINLQCIDTEYFEIHIFIREGYAAFDKLSFFATHKQCVDLLDWMTTKKDEITINEL